MRLRSESKDEQAQKKSHTYTSPRTLLGVLRLAQALARLRLSEAVTHEDVEEALRLMQVSRKSLDDDEDDTHDFSFGMTEAYFTQASTTFTDMDKALCAPLLFLLRVPFSRDSIVPGLATDASESKDLQKLSSLGHFLKGSSATLGVSRVQLSCQKIQHYGEKKNEGKDLSDDEALSRIGELLGKVKVDFRTAEEWLQAWYRENAVED